jgi:large subunit ribosomal protein L15
MPVRYGRYIRKKRGTRVCGYGRISQHRNKGQRGGCGMFVAKLRQHRTKYIIERNAGFPTHYMGRTWELGHRGFHIPATLVRLRKCNTLNIIDLEMSVDKWVAAGQAEKRGETYVVNLETVDFGKLLGKGMITKKLDVTVAKASEKVVEKFKAAGCKLTVTKEDEEEDAE